MDKPKNKQQGFIVLYKPYWNTYPPWGQKKEQIVKRQLQLAEALPHTLTLSLLKMPREHGMTEWAGMERRERQVRVMMRGGLKEKKVYNSKMVIGKTR